MITHSKPFSSPTNLKRIRSTIAEKSYVSDSYSADVKTKYMARFGLTNLYFTPSGAHALYWIIKGLGLDREDEVIIPTYSCYSIYKAIIAAGAHHVLCDVGESTWLMSADTVEQKLSKKTKAIVLVNLFGFILSCEEFRFNKEVHLINDLCQSPIELMKGVDYGDFAFYSFHPTKFLNGGGGGAFSILNDLPHFSNHLSNKRLGDPVSNLFLSLLEEQINLYNYFVSRRRKIAASFEKSLGPKLRMKMGENKLFFRFPIRQINNSFEEVEAYFFEKGIICRRGVDELTHRIISQSDALYPNAVKNYEQTISVPIYPSMSDEESKIISRALRNFFHE